jgi:hypothetical protein
MRLVSLGHNQNLITIGNDEFYFSYNTCVAVRNAYGEFRIQSPSATTTRHMQQMGIINFPLISEEEFTQYLPTTTLPSLTK